MRPYKYAGYPQLIKTIRLETKDDDLFSKETQLLTAASELCYHTVHCSALNAEELRREEGIEALLEAYDRCVSIMGADSKPDSLHYQVISNVTRCFEVACNFEKCKQKIITLPRLMSDVCRVVYFKHTLSVSLVTSLAANNYELQCNLACNGVLWSLLLFCFEYDYTLDESGVEASDKTNQQQQANTLSKMAILACIALAGYGLELRTTPETKSVTSSENNSPTASAATASIKAPSIPPKPKTAYTQNAQNPLNKQLAITSGQEGSTSSSVVSKQDSTASEKSEAGTPDQNAKALDLLRQKYIVTSDAQNTVVKQVLDRLLTKYIANKLTKEKDCEVNVIYTYIFLKMRIFMLLKVFTKGIQVKSCTFTKKQNCKNKKTTT